MSRPLSNKNFMVFYQQRGVLNLYKKLTILFTYSSSSSTQSNKFNIILF